MGQAAEQVALRNNLVSAPNARERVLVDGTPGPGFVQDHNLLTPTPGFARGSPEPFALEPRSPAVDAGAPLREVHTDYLRVARPRGAGHDVGAFESR